MQITINGPVNSIDQDPLSWLSLRPWSDLYEIGHARCCLMFDILCLSLQPSLDIHVDIEDLFKVEYDKHQT